MFRKLTKTLAPVAAVALLTALPALAIAQPYEQGKMHGGMQGESSTMMDCQQMVKMKEQVQAKQEQMQVELDGMVAHMNAVSGKAQQQAMAELLTKLVEQRGAMQPMMMEMQPMMMGHMMQHMQSGKMGDMSDCPMMKSMQGKDDGTKSENSDKHSEHH